MRPNFFHHLHPPTIPKNQSRWRYTLGAGGTAVFLFLILLITGMLEMFFYIPTPENAALSIQTITFLVPFGSLVRNMHFWSAQLLLIISAVHLLRVVYTAAYTKPRSFNYLLGLGLFVLILMLDFTGYILRWDTGIHWALVVGTNLLKTIPLIGGQIYQFVVGDPQLGGATLIRFYTWHIVGLMIPAIFLVGWHVFRVRRDGGIAVPLPRSPDRITRFELVNKEVLAMLYTSAALVVLSIFIPAPLGAQTHDKIVYIGSSTATAPWFFLWVQQMLKWGDPFIWGILIPIFVLFVLALIPYFFPKPDPSQIGRWFPRSNLVQSIVITVLMMIILILTVIADVQ